MRLIDDGSRRNIGIHGEIFRYSIYTACGFLFLSSVIGAGLIVYDRLQKNRGATSFHIEYTPKEPYTASSTKRTIVLTEEEKKYRDDLRLENKIERIERRLKSKEKKESLTEEEGELSLKARSYLSENAPTLDAYVSEYGPTIGTFVSEYLSPINDYISERFSKISNYVKSTTAEFKGWRKSHADEVITSKENKQELSNEENSFSNTLVWQYTSMFLEYVFPQKVTVDGTIVPKKMTLEGIEIPSKTRLVFDCSLGGPNVKLRIFGERISYQYIIQNIKSHYRDSQQCIDIILNSHVFPKLIDKLGLEDSDPSINYRTSGPAMRPDAYSKLGQAQESKKEPVLKEPKNEDSDPDPLFKLEGVISDIGNIAEDVIEGVTPKDANASHPIGIVHIGREKVKIVNPRYEKKIYDNSIDKRDKTKTKNKIIDKGDKIWIY